MRKKIILSVIAFIIIAAVGYGYSIVNGKEYIAGGQGDIVENSIVFSKNINVESSFTLVDLQMDSILGELVFDEDGNCILPVFDEIKDSSSFKVNNEIKTIRATVTNDNNDVIKEFEFKTGSKVSEKILLTSSGNYNIRLYSGEFKGVYKVDIESYKIF